MESKLARCLMAQLPLVAALDRQCFEDPLPPDDLCEYLSPGWVSENFFSDLDFGPTQKGIALAVLPACSGFTSDLVGFVLLVVREELGLIERIGIHPSFRGQGLAKFMLEAVRTQSRRFGVSIWGVELEEDDFASQAFFGHLGFQSAAPANALSGVSTVVQWCRSAD